MKPHHVEASRADRLTALCRRTGVEPALGLAADLLPLNRGVLLLIGQTNAGRLFWVERAGLALDPRTEPTDVVSAEEFRARIGLVRPPMAVDRHGIKALWLEEDPKVAWGALMRLLG